MHRTRSLSFFALALSAFGLAASPALADCPIVHIGAGQLSGYGLNQPRFKGAELAILTPGAWNAFWAKHTSHLEDPPPPPDVNFENFIVLAAIQGKHPTRNGPHVEIVKVANHDGFTNVTIIDDERPGDVEEISNAFHIVKVPRDCVFPNGGFAFNLKAPPPPPGQVAGHVFAETPEGPVPLPGAVVRLIRDGHVVKETTTNDAGAYGFPAVLPGQLNMLVTKPGFEPATAEIVVESNETTIKDFVLIHLPPPGAIVGHVFKATPEGPMPLGGAVVKLIKNDQVLAVKTTGPGGGYEFGNVPPGAYALMAGKPGYIPQTVEVLVEPGSMITQDFVLEPAD